MREELPTAISGPPTISAETAGNSLSISSIDSLNILSSRELCSVSELPKGESIIATARLISGVKM